MNRLLSILVAIFVLFLLYIWINHLVTSANPGKVENTEENTLSDNDYSADAYALSNYKKQDHLRTQQQEEDEEQSPAQIEVEHEEEPAQQKAEPKPATKPVEKKKTPAPAVTPVSAGEHLVIAGNFLDRANAQKRVEELRSFGYQSAEVVNFELSEYHTACAGRFGDLTEARRVAKKIKDHHNIDTYVRNGNQP